MASTSNTRRRRSTIEIPLNRNDFEALLMRPKAQQDYGYSDCLTDDATNRRFEHAHSVNVHRFNLDNTVLQSWICDESGNLRPPKPAINNVPRTVQKHAAETFSSGGTVATADSLRQFRKDLVSNFVILVPIFVEYPTTSRLVKGFIVSTETTYFPIDAEDEPTNLVLQECILEDPAVWKIFINAALELDICWVNLGASPTNVLCLTTATKNILEAFEMDYKVDMAAVEGGRLPMFPFWKYLDTAPKPVTANILRGVLDPCFASAMKSIVELTALVLSGSQYINNAGHWSTCFRFNRLLSISNLRGLYLTSHLGINFWQAISQAINTKLSLPLYSICFLYENFGTLAYSTRRDIGFVVGRDRYDQVKHIVDNAEEYQHELELSQNRADVALMSPNTFNYVCANVILGNVELHRGVEMGTVGELLRRLEHYAPCLLP